MRFVLINPTRMKKLGVIPGLIVDEAKQFFVDPLEPEKELSI